MGQRFELVIADDGGVVPVDIRLRQLLKRLLRSCCFRLVQIKQVYPEGRSTGEPDDGGTRG